MNMEEENSEKCEDSPPSVSENSLKDEGLVESQIATPVDVSPPILDNTFTFKPFEADTKEYVKSPDSLEGSEGKVTPTLINLNITPSEASGDTKPDRKTPSPAVILSSRARHKAEKSPRNQAARGGRVHRKNIPFPNTTTPSSALQGVLPQARNTFRRLRQFEEKQEVKEGTEGENSNDDGDKQQNKREKR
jgi:hypothetical protein